MRKNIWILLIVLCGCTPQPDRASVSAEGNAYAGGFQIEDFRGYSLLTVSRPWQNAENSDRMRYILYRENVQLPDSLIGLSKIKVPVHKAAALSSGYVAMLSALGEQRSICAISGSGYIYDSLLRERISLGLISDVGYDQQLNYEALVDINPDVLFLYGVDPSVKTIIRKLDELGITAVICSDYLESEPLGKSEWIRFFSRFYACPEKGDSIFSEVSYRYLTIKDKMKGISHRPKVLSGLPWKDTWYIPGGNSFAARFISDAGGEYLWKEDRSFEAVPMDLESVYLRAIEADVWINPGDADDLKSIEAYDNRFGQLQVVQLGKVYNNNARVTYDGGNDYWESGIMYPDRILADLAEIFHPGSVKGHSWTYYKRLK